MTNDYRKDWITLMEAFEEALGVDLAYTEYHQAAVHIRELVDKETPMKPVDYDRCPRCNNKVWLRLKGGAGIKMQRCNGVKCGQRIDWRKDNDNE